MWDYISGEAGVSSTLSIWTSGLEEQKLMMGSNSILLPPPIARDVSCFGFGDDKIPAAENIH